MKRVAVAIIPGEGRKILMGRRSDNGKMSCVAGGIDEGETPMEGLIREVKEESGLTVVNAKLVTTGKTKFGTEICVFLVKATGTVDTSKDPDKEFKTLWWADPKDHIGNLHVPWEDSIAFQWLEKNT